MRPILSLLRSLWFITHKTFSEIVTSKLSEIAYPKSSRSLSVISSSPYSTIWAIFDLVKPDDLWWRRKLKITIFSEEATSAFKLVFMRVLYHLEVLVFLEGRKAETRRKTLGAGWEPTTNSLVGGKRSRHHAIPAPQDVQGSDIIWIPSLPYASSSEDVHQCWSPNTL